MTGDCCLDYKAMCGVSGTATSVPKQNSSGVGCKARCGQPWIPEEQCTCDPKRCECKPELCCSDFKQQCKPRTAAPTVSPCIAKYSLDSKLQRCGNSEYFTSYFAYKDLNRMTDTYKGKVVYMERGIRAQMEGMCNSNPECAGFSCWAPKVKGKGTALPFDKCQGDDARLYANWQLCASMTSAARSANVSISPPAAVWKKSDCVPVCPKTSDGKECGGEERGEPVVKTGSRGAKACKCKCKPGWSGNTCENPLCPIDGNKLCGCHGDPQIKNGKCKCQCHTGWSGKSCATPLCPSVSQGCSFSDKKPGDIPGWGYLMTKAATLDDCQIACCKDAKCVAIQFSAKAVEGANKQCALHNRFTVKQYRSGAKPFKDYSVYFAHRSTGTSGKGMCSRHLCGGVKAGLAVIGSDGMCSCKCKANYEGKGCDEPKCLKGKNGKKCSGNGDCTRISDDLVACKCHPGWKGKICDDPLCPLGGKYGDQLCAGNGVAVMSTAADGKAVCSC